MAQPGLHGVLALAARKGFSKKPWFALGLAFGALLPDADGYAQAFGSIVQGMDAATAEAIYHRTLTHSLFFAAAVGLVFHLLSQVLRKESWASFGWGMAIGIAVLHTLVDIFIWFDGVGILWPLWEINLWEGVELSPTVGQLLRSANFLAFGLYFAFLIFLARRAGTDQAYLGRLRIYTYAQFGLGILLSVLAFVLSGKTYDTLDGALFLFLAFPNVLWVTWRMRATIEAA